LEFETEYFNEAEEAVQHMHFDPGDGVNPRTGEMEPEMELKMTVMDIYNSRLDARVERKKIIFEHKLLEYRNNTQKDKKRTKEERELLNKAKPFARMMKHEDFDEFCKGLLYEHQLRQAIAQLIDWRQHQVDTLKAGEKYEQEKQQRQSRAPPLGSFDRLASSRLGKPTPPFEIASETQRLTGPELPERLKTTGLSTPPPDRPVNGTNGANVAPAPFTKAKFTFRPLPNTVPLKFGKEAIADLQLLTPEERELCSMLRIMPKSYISIKDKLLQEALMNGGTLSKKVAKQICRIDVNKAGQIFEFFVHCGWIAKA